MQTQVSQVYKTLVRARIVWRDYVSLTKPRVVSLLLLTTVATMLIAGERVPPVSVIVFTLLGGFLAAGGAGALNCYFDRDIDGLMGRTKTRPLPAGRLEPKQARNFGLGLSVLSFLLLWLGANLLAASLALLGIVWYVLIYTTWLKRRFSQNIVIGGAAGAFPPLVGYAAATGTLSFEALLLFAIIFYWTPPHFWALALLLRNDYARAGVPMLPVVSGKRVTHGQIMLYTILTVLLTLIFPVFSSMGVLYFLTAFILGMGFFFQAYQLTQLADSRSAWQFFRYSLLYLALLFVAMVADQLAFTYYILR